MGARERGFGTFAEDVEERSDTSWRLSCATRSLHLVGKPVSGARWRDQAIVFSIPAENHVAVVLGSAFPMVLALFQMGMANWRALLDHVRVRVQVLRGRC